tara:strand:+ start:403 stop:561 length:159 start_codon:yes stop_codon:yes gene_type:complete
MRDLVDEINGSVGKKLEDFQKMSREYDDYDDKEEEEEELGDDLDRIVSLGED